MISQPTVTVYCDGKDCDFAEDYELTTMARGYSEVNLASEMRRDGWVTVNDNTHLCPDCVALQKESTP